MEHGREDGPAVARTGSSPESGGARPGWFSSIPLAAALLGLGLGSALLLGWAFDVSAVRSLLDDLITIRPGIALSLFLGGASLLMLRRGPNGYAWCRVFAALLLGVMGVAWTLLARTQGNVATEAARGLHALGFTLQAVALLLLTNRRLSFRRIGADLALAAAFVGWAGLVGYAYSIALAADGQISGMVFSSLGAAILGLGTAAVGENSRSLRVLRSNGPGGALARYLLPFVVLAPFAFGLLHVVLQRAGWDESLLGDAALAVGSTLVFASIIGVYASWLDRSEGRRLAAERVLRESAEFNIQIVASAQEGIVVVDAHQRCVLWNPFMERLTGTPAQEVVGRPIVEAASFDGLTGVEAVERALAGHHVKNDVEWISASGSVWLLVAHTPLTGTDGRILGAIITIHDLSELKSAERALRESRKRKSIALTELGVSLWEIDLETRSVVWIQRPDGDPEPPQALLTIDDVINRIHPDDRLDARAAIEHAMATEGEFAIDTRLDTRDSRTRWVHSSGRVVTDPLASTRRLLSVSSDVTSRHLLEEQYLQAQKMEAIGQLAGGVAHDFNNLLMAILGYSDLIREGTSDENSRRNVGEVIKAATRATALTKQLLAFSRRKAAEMVVVNANEVVQDLLEMLRRLIGDHVTLTTALAGDLHTIRADRGQLGQVIMNLAVNARDAMPSGGTITIETANLRLDSEMAGQDSVISPGEYVVLAVSDTGTGMTEEVRRHLFEPFFTTKERGKGTGLGLATVHGIVTACHGHIAVNSQVGKGTTFTIYLPRVAQPLLERRTQLAEPPRPLEFTASSVLIVEDEEAVRYLARVILERAGHTVFEAGTAEEAESVLLRAGPVDVLVSDVMLQQGRGPDLYALLRQRYPALRAVFMSGYAEESVLEEIARDPAMRFIQKPFVAETLLNSVAALSRKSATASVH